MLSRLLAVISWGFLFIGVNGASFVRRSSDIWVTGCNYVESVTYVRKCSNISLWGRQSLPVGSPSNQLATMLLIVRSNVTVTVRILCGTFSSKIADAAVPNRKRVYKCMRSFRATPSILDSRTRQRHIGSCIHTRHAWFMNSTTRIVQQA